MGGGRWTSTAAAARRHAPRVATRWGRHGRQKGGSVGLGRGAGGAVHTRTSTARPHDGPSRFSPPLSTAPPASPRNGPCACGRRGRRPPFKPRPPRRASRGGGLTSWRHASAAGRAAATPVSGHAGPLSPPLWWGPTNPPPPLLSSASVTHTAACQSPLPQRSARQRPCGARSHRHPPKRSPPADAPPSPADAVAATAARPGRRDPPNPPPPRGRSGIAVRHSAEGEQWGAGGGGGGGTERRVCQALMADTAGGGCCRRAVAAWAVRASRWHGSQRQWRPPRRAPSRRRRGGSREAAVNRPCWL